MKKSKGSTDRHKIVYDPFKSPPSYDKAKQHRKASMVGIVSKKVKKRRCECCMYPIDRQSFDFRCSNSQLAFLGTSLAFYFEAMKMSVTLLALMLLSVLVPIALFNSELKCCEIKPPFIVSLVMNNLKQPLGVSLTCVLSIVAIFFGRKYGVRKIQNFENDNPCESLFAIKLSNLPVCEQYQIKKWVTSISGSEPFYVEIAYDIREWQDAFHKRQELTIYKNRKNQTDVDESMDYGLTNSLTTLFLNQKKTDIREIDQEIKKLDQILLKYKSHFTLITQKRIGIAFVIFDSPKTIEEFISRRQTKRENRFVFKEKVVTIEKAPNPHDIKWENLAARGKKSSQTLSFLAIFIGIAFLLFLCLYLRNATKEYKLFKNYPEIAYPAVLGVYSIYHLGVHFLVQLVVRLSRCETYTAEKLITFRTYTLLNTLLCLSLPYFLNLIYRNLVLVINFTLLIDALTHPLIKACNPSHITQKLYGEYIKKLQPRKNVYTQDYLNRLMEGQQFALGQNYHYILRGLFLSAYYAYPAPLGFLYYLLGFTIEALLMKYLLVKHSKTPPKLSYHLAHYLLHAAGLVPFCMALGAVVFRLLGNQRSFWDLWLEWLLLIASAAFAVYYGLYLSQIPYNFKPQQSYYACRQRFTEVYRWANPLKRMNGELFNNFHTGRQMAMVTPDPECSDKEKNSHLDSRSTVDKSRFRIINRLSLNNELMDIHVNEECRRAGD